MSVTNCFDHLEASNAKCDVIVKELSEVFATIPLSLLNTKLKKCYDVVPLSAIGTAAKDRTDAFNAQIRDTLDAFRHKLTLLEGEERRMKNEKQQHESENQNITNLYAREEVEQKNRELLRLEEKSEELCMTIRRTLRNLALENPGFDDILAEFSAVSNDAETLPRFESQLKRMKSNKLDTSRNSLSGLKTELNMYRKRLSLLKLQSSNSCLQVPDPESVLKEELDESLEQASYKYEEAKQEQIELNKSLSVAHMQLEKLLNRLFPSDQNHSEKLRELLVLLHEKKATSSDTAISVGQEMVEALNNTSLRQIVTCQVVGQEHRVWLTRNMLQH